MRRIVLYISLLLVAIGCRGSEEAVVESRSIASLWSYVRRETVLITEDISLRGYIVANETCCTRTAGVFVAGDCRTKGIRQITTATGDGASAALAACKYIEDTRMM